MHVRGRLGGRHGALQHVSFPTGPLQCLVFHADAGEREDGVRQCGPVDGGAWRPHDAGVILPQRDGSCARLAVAIPQLLGNPHTTPAQRVALVASYNNYQLDPPISLDPLADFLVRRPNEPAEVVAAAIEVVGASPTGLESPRALAFVLSVLSRDDLDIRLAGIQAVEATRLATAAPQLLKMLADTSHPAAERVALVKALRVMNYRPAVAPLKELLVGPQPASLKVEALRTLAILDATVARTVAEPLLDQPDKALLTEAVTVLGATKSGARVIGERYIVKKLPRDMFPQVADALKNFAADDPEAARLQSEVLKGGLLLSLEPGQSEKIRQQVLTKGDPKKGKEIYLNTAVLACAYCHKLEGVGGSTGPDLTRVWDTHTVEKLLESIIDPSKEIKEGYQSYRVITTNGQTLLGLKVTETGKELVIRDANGRDIRLAKDDVESISPTKQSLMPDNVASRLTYDQFIDLLAFLKSRQEQESLRGVVVEVGVAGPFSPDLKPTQPEVGTGPSIVTKWHAAFADPTGTIDLAGAFPSAAPAGVYVQTFVFSPKEQQAIGWLRTEAPVRVWVNGAASFDRASVKPVALGTDEVFAVSLKSGWNVVLMKVTNAGKSQRLGLRFNGTDVRTAGSPVATPTAARTTAGSR